MTVRADERLAAGAVLLVSFVLYLVTLCPGPFWLDTSELIAGAHTLGIVHPPAHPVWVMLAKALGLLLPFGSVGFRVNLLSALCGALTAALTTSLACALAPHAGHTRLARWASLLPPVAAGLLAATTDACWMQSVRAEVYTLNAALVLGALRLAVAWLDRPEPSRVLAAGALLGLGLGNHHYLVFFALPAFMAVLVARPAGRALLRSRLVGLVCATVLATLLAYAYLPVRAATDPWLDWGDPRTPTRLWNVLTAKAFQASVVTAERSPLAANVLDALRMVLAQASTLPCLLAALGVVLLVVRQRSAALLVGVAFLGNLLTKGLMRLDAGNPDDYGYLMLAVLLVLALAGALPGLTRAFRPRWTVGASAAMGCALLIATAQGALERQPYNDLSRDDSVEALVGTAIDDVPPNAIVLPNYYGLYFGAWHGLLVEDRRPDVRLVHATFDSAHDGGLPYVAVLSRRAPELAPVLEAFSARGAFPESALLDLARTRPVLLEPLPDALAVPDALDDVGLFRRLRPDAAARNDVTASALRSVANRALDDALAGTPLHTEARKVRLWLAFLDAGLAVRQGHAITAGFAIDRGRRFGGKGAFDRLETLARGALEAERAVRRAESELAPFAAAMRGARGVVWGRLDPLKLM